VTVFRRSPLQLLVIAVALAAGIAAAAGLAYLFLRPAAPAPVGAASPAPGSSASSAAPRTGAVSTLGADGLNGDWAIDQTIGSFSDFSGSFVGYRVNETFTNQRANEAVGRTPQVTGTLAFAGTTITAVEVTADLTRLQSDDDRRDGQLRRQALETDRFPTATFKLTSPIELASAPVDGSPFSATAAGELTLHGARKAVEVPVEATLAGGVVTVTGKIDIRFADYGIEQPSSFIVLSIEDHGTMEFQLHFRKG
jgi:polyisoprenoid-binding protein YceI